MKIKNVEKTSMVDFPPYISCVVFLAGCNFNCPFCYNKSLIDINDNSLPDIDKDEFLYWLSGRKGKLDAVTISGGEASIHGDDLIDFAKGIKSLDFKLKLDTNGTNPDIIKRMIDNNLVDYIAVDIKSDYEGYDAACGTKVDISKIKETIKLLEESPIEYEFRTTVVPGLHTEDTLKRIIGYFSKPVKYAIQQFKPISTNNPTYEKIIPFTDGEMEKFKADMELLKTAANIEFRR